VIIKAADKRCKSETRLDRDFRLTGLPFWKNYHNFALLERDTLQFIDYESISHLLKRRCSSLPATCELTQMVECVILARCGQILRLRLRRAISKATCTVYCSVDSLVSNPHPYEYTISIELRVNKMEDCL
jgi:hypothetical protein